MSSNSKAPKAKAQRPFLKSKVHPIVKVVEETYQGPAPESLDLAQLYMALPTRKSSMYIDPIDAVVIKALDTIRKQYKVWINVDKTKEYFIIEGVTVENTGGALREIREFLHHQAKSLGGAVTILAHRIGGSQTDIKLKRLRQVAGTRFGLPEGSWRGVALSGTTEKNLAQAVQRHMVKELFEAIQKSVRGLRPDVGEKYVRVHLGLRTLSKKIRAETLGLEGTLSKKETSEPFDPFGPDALDKYDTTQYESLLDSATQRGHSYFNLCFGDEDLTETILHYIHKTDLNNVPYTKYVPHDPTVGRLKDIKPQFTLVFFSVGYRIEMDIQFETIRGAATTVLGNVPAQPLEWNRPTASPPRVFRFNKMVDAEVIVPCPDLKLDWQITVESDLGANKIHEKFRTLATELRFTPVLAGTLTFPTVNVSRSALLKAHIDGIAMKMYRTFESVDAPYHIQVATYYDWNAAPLPRYLARPDIMEYEYGTEQCSNCPVPNKSCAVSLYGSYWDDQIHNLNPASMDFSAELMKLFYDREICESHGLTVAGELATHDLLREVACLLDITTKAVTELESLRPSLDLEEKDDENVKNVENDDLLVDFSAPATTQAASVPNDVPAQTGVHSKFIPKFNYGNVHTSKPGRTLFDWKDTTIPDTNAAPAQGQTDAKSPIEPSAAAAEESLMDFSPETRSETHSECLLDFDAQPDAN